MLARTLTLFAAALLGSVPFLVQAGETGQRVEVLAVQPTRVADIVVLNQGYEAGLRQGMVCRVTRGATEIAEVILVELRPQFSAALILNASPMQAIRPHDVATIKVSKS